MNIFAFLYYVSGCFVLTSLLVVVKYATIRYKIPFEELLFIRQSIIVSLIIPILIKRKINLFKGEMIVLQYKRHFLFAISTLLWYNALIIAPVNDVMGIASMTPILGAALAIILLKETPKKGMKITLLLCFLGSITIKRPSFSNLDNDDMLGYILAMSVVILRAYLVPLNKKLASKVNELNLIASLNVAMLCFFGLFFHKFTTVPLGMLPYIAYAAIAFFLEYLLINRAYKLASASILQPLDFSKPIFSIILSHLILNEKATLTQIIGTGIIIVGYTYFVMINKKQ